MVARNRTNSKRRGKKRTKKNVETTRSGQAFVGLTAVSDAFAFGAQSIAESDAIRSGRKLRGQQLVSDARSLDRGAEDIIESGKERAREISKEGAQDAGALRAKLAGQGIQVDFGTGAEAVEDILAVSGQDASTVKLNALRRAHGLRVEAIDKRSQATLDRIVSKKKEDDTVLTGGLKSVRALSQGVQQSDGFSAFKFTKGP